MERIKLSALACVATILMSGTASAADKMYAVVGMGGSSSDFADTSSNGLSYRLAVGHQFDPQWYVELGYQNLIDDSPSDDSTGLSAEALSLSALGKAANKDGELFYRIGIANIDIEGQSLADSEGACQYGNVVGVTADATNLCGFDEGVFGAVVGLGYDWHLSFNTMLRFETEYMLGEDDFSNGAVYIGFRYNFN